MNFKKIKYLILPLLLLLFQTVFAVDTFYDKTVKALDSYGKVHYYGSFVFDSTASGDTYHTQAFQIAALSAGNAYGYFVCSEVGTEDVNVFVEYSLDRVNWTAGTTNSALDALGTTAVEDTLNIIAGAAETKYKTFIWMRLKFVAGAAIGATTVTFSVSFEKPASAAHKKCANVADRLTS
jgi:hypothetical protein